MPVAVRGRRGGSWPAVVPALALHAACLGALLGLQYTRTAQPAPEDAIVELAVVPAPERPVPAPPEPAVPEPSTPGPATSVVDEPVTPAPPEPVETAAIMPATTSPPTVEAEPAPEPAETPLPLPPDALPMAPEPIAAVAPLPAEIRPTPPVVELAPPRPRMTPQPQPNRPQPRPHAAVVPRTSLARQGSAAMGTPVNLAAIAPTAPAPSSADQEATLEARIRDAVQAAVHYPASARMMGITGRARVLLDYRSGGVAGPAITQSSGTPLLDEAALAAARTAHYPPAPAEIEGRLLRLLVWVEFKPG